MKNTMENIANLSIVQFFTVIALNLKTAADIQLEVPGDQEMAKNPSVILAEMC